VVSAPDVIELYAGRSGRLRLAGLGASALAAVGICLAGATAESTAAWLCVLTAVHWGLARTGDREQNCGRLMLRADGSASLLSGRRLLRLQRGATHWFSRFFCVLTLREALSGRRVRLLICPTLNSPDDYRRLQVFLRVAASGQPNDTVRWL